MTARREIRALPFLIGFTAAIAQIVLMRELLVVFCGNEISLGLMLGSWLAWTAVGSGGLGRIAARARDPRRLCAVFLAVLAMALPGAILMVRFGKGALEAVPGENLGPGAMLAASLAALCLFCVFSGALFAAAGRLYQEERVAPAEATGSVYWREALGSAAGGVLAGLVLVRHLGSLPIALWLALINLLAAACLAIGKRPARRLAMGVLAGLAVLAALPFGASRLEAVSVARFWRGFRLVAATNSVYGNLAVVEAGGTRSLYENGLPLFHSPDPAAAEEAVDYALLEHPRPRSLLLIGGGFNGSLAEALRHRSLERLDYVELDPAVLDLARRYFPAEWALVRADSRVRVHVADGRLFVKTTASTFDVLVVNLPDPQTAQLNRFFTLEFFREAARRLAAGGVLSFQVTGSENYLSPELAAFLRSINKTLRAVFPEVAVIPGGTVHFFAALRPGVLAAGSGGLLERLRERRLGTSYVREYYIPFRMMPDRIGDLESEIRPRPDTPLNRDFAPIAYYFNVALWSGRFGQGYRHLFGALGSVDFRFLAAGLAVLLAALAAAGRAVAGTQRRLRLAAASCAASMGFTLIGLEILLLLAFQAIYGYVYQQLAVLVAAFMGGMALGGWLALRPGAPDLHRLLRLLAALQALGALAPLLLCAVFPVIPAGLAAAFPALALCSGLLGGYEFPVASRVYFAAGRGRRAGTLYALDLAGSCAGAVLFSAYLVPVFGFSKTAVLMSLTALAPAALAVAVTPGPGTTRRCVV